MSQLDFDYTVSTKPAPKPGTKAKATITELKELKAADIFKTGARNPEQLVFAIFAKVDDWQGRIGAINKPNSKQISTKHKLAAFKQRYKNFPKIGMQVDVVANEKGYWKLEL